MQAQRRGPSGGAPPAVKEGAVSTSRTHDCRNGRRCHGSDGSGHSHRHGEAGPRRLAHPLNVHRGDECYRVGRGDEERHAPTDRVGVEELGAGGDADSVKGEEEAHPPVRCKGGSDCPRPVQTPLRRTILFTFPAVGTSFLKTCPNRSWQQAHQGVSGAFTAHVFFQYPERP